MSSRLKAELRAFPSRRLKGFVFLTTFSRSRFRMFCKIREINVIRGLNGAFEVYYSRVAFAASALHACRQLFAESGAFLQCPLPFDPRHLFPLKDHRAQA